MRIDVSDAARQLEERELLQRSRDDHSDRVIDHVRELIGRELPADLVAFYRERITRIGDFHSMIPEWNERVGWRSPDALVTALLHADAVPIFDDGCGNLYGVDLMQEAKTPAVYFFDHERGYENPVWAAGSSLGAFLLLLAEADRAQDEGWPPKWQLGIDPDIERCPRAPAIWSAG